MPQAKQTSKLKRRSKALPILGAAGLSLSLASAASAVPSGLGDMPNSKTGDDNRVTLGEEDISLAPFYAFDKESEGTGVTLGEEEISDVSLATFYVFDKQTEGTAQSDIELVRGGCGGCHGCRGCGGCGCASFFFGGCGGCGGCGGGNWCWWRGRLIWCGW